MLSQDLKQFNLPDQPGVYYFTRRTKGREEILYVGKATSLRDRVKSYFNKDLIAGRGPRIVAMVEQAENVKFIKTDSVLEALILEALEIKKYHPDYNVREKDDRSFNYVIITNDEFPKLEVVRGRALIEDEFIAKRTKYSFGPFPHGSELREALRLIRKIIPYSDNKCRAGSGKPCFNYQIGLCPGVCIGAVSKTAYGQTIRNLKLLFEGKKKQIITNLEKEMKVLAKKQDFEQAKIVRNRIFALNHIQDVALVKNHQSTGEQNITYRIEGYDIAHLSGQNTVGVMVVWEDGEINKSAYRKFKLRGASASKADDIGNLKEILERRLRHTEWPLPNLIVIDGGKAQLNLAKKAVKASNFMIDVVSVVKDEHHQPREILGDKKIATEKGKEIILADSEAHRFAVKYHRTYFKIKRS